MPTDIRKSAAQDEALENEYKQWQKVHSKMKDTPPSDGRDYLKHASNLLGILEGVSELHPIAKAVVISFKTAVMFEQDRRENDARVTAVFLAQTDMMSVLLDVDDLSTRRRNRWPDAENLRSTARLGHVLANMEKEIKSCGNSIDTYYKESRFVKFWKAQDWKKRMLGHIAEFNEHRVQLQTILEVQIATGVEDLVLKMDVVLSHFFTPKADWEKNLDKKTRSMGPPSTWINDPAVLQSLISETKDPAFSFTPAKGKDDKSKTADKPADGANIKDTEKEKIAFATDAQLAKVKKELELSLDILCERNKDMFEVKLNFHTKQIEQSIANSAQLVIKSLSGPYDRLVHEDLRHLWKEMNWIFCVENKFFVSAVFEFYLDRFSGKKHVHKIESGNGEGHEADGDPNTLAVVKFESAPKFSFLSRLGGVQHPDSWTLEYIAMYGDNITQAIDNDNSGFIRISEANSFSQAIPKGWNLPQWCAYCAAGWVYENRIYRARINKLLSTLTEMQAKVLGTNRGFLVEFSTFFYDTICYAFSREPMDQRIPSTTQELRDLVKQKVIEQDDLYRGYLQSLKWTLEDEATINLLYGGKPPEKFILQLCTLVLEQTLALARKCTQVTVDIREWARLSAAFQLIRKITANHVEELKVRFGDAKFSGEGFNTYYGGMWTYFDGDIPYTLDELVDAISRSYILNDFPISKITAESAHLQFLPWEEHVKTLSRSEIPPLIPRAWDPVYENLYENMRDRTYFSQFPDEWYCDRCHKEPKREGRYRCLSIMCRRPGGFDFCNSCHILPPEYHTVGIHNYRHAAVLHFLQYSSDDNKRFTLEAEIVFEYLAQEFSAQDRYEYSENTRDGAALNDEDDEDDLLDKMANEFGDAFGDSDDGGGDSDVDGAPARQKYILPARLTLKCEMCKHDIKVESEFFKCIGHSCTNYYLCRDCAMQHPRRDVPDGAHAWWHSLLCLRKDIILGYWDDPIPYVIHTDAIQDANSSDDAVHARIGILEEKLDSIYHSNATLDERVKGLEVKIDAVIAGLQQLLGGNLPMAPAPAPAAATSTQFQSAPGQPHNVSSREIQAPSSREIVPPASRPPQAPTSRAIPNYAQDNTPREGPGLLQQIRDYGYQNDQDQEHRDQDEPEEPEEYGQHQGYGSQPMGQQQYSAHQQRGYDEPEESQQYQGYGSQGYGSQARGQQQRGAYQEQRGYDEPEDDDEPAHNQGYGHYGGRQQSGYGGQPDDEEFGNAADEFAQGEPEDDGYYRDY